MVRQAWAGRRTVDPVVAAEAYPGTELVVGNVSIGSWKLIYRRDAERHLPYVIAQCYCHQTRYSIYLPLRDDQAELVVKASVPMNGEHDHDAEDANPQRVGVIGARLRTSHKLYEPT